MIDKIIRHQTLSNPAIFDTRTGQSLSYKQLIKRIKEISSAIKKVSPKRSLIFLKSENSVESILIYLACLNLDYPICILPNISQNLLENYGFPILTLSSNEIPPKDYQEQESISLDNYKVYKNKKNIRGKLHADLSLLLSTSGSTGSPKLIKLTKRNIESYSASIAIYLKLNPKERAILSLPMYYSYGLSLVNSHLFAGGTLIVTPHSFITPSFWNDFDKYGSTSFAGVPYMYEVLYRLKFNPSDHPTLSTMTQAGGRLRNNLILHFNKILKKGGGKFFVMYGQTEATSRISYLPPDRLEEKIGSVGIAIPGGKVSLLPRESGFSELIYEGKNVMMGYALNLQSLEIGDELHGILHTGDYAYLDNENFIYLVGRASRYSKLFGARVSLDDIELHVSDYLDVPVYVIGNDNNQIGIFIESSKELDINKIKKEVARFLAVTPQAVLVKQVDKLPRKENFKSDHNSLRL